jgi:TRAP-type C4-dicarboxylate transport system substrate-binding protein
MARWKGLLAAVLAFAALCIPGSTSLPTAAADGPIVIRYASLAPGNSSFGKVLKAWNRSVKKETEGRVEIRSCERYEWGRSTPRESPPSASV